MIYIIVFITIIYCILIISFIVGFDRVEEFYTRNLNEKTKFSIIIPFRNEAENLLDLLQSLNELEYPNHLFEILLVDDDSEDKSVETINIFIKQQLQNSHCIDIKLHNNKRLTNSPKKDAITTAIKFAKHEWIITTDADCIVPRLWLNTLDAFIQNNNPKMIVAPVTYSVSNLFLEHFQLLDFLSLQSVTIAGFGIKKPFLCNGANLAYKKELFTALNGFTGNSEIASGDDIFLMEKAIVNVYEKVMYLKSKNVIVITKPEPTLKGLIQQRLRWAAKTSSYNNTLGKMVGLIVISMNSLIIASLLLFLIGKITFKFFILIFALKFFLDLILISKPTRFFNQKLNLSFYLSSSFLYPFFSVYIAVCSTIFGYKWKSRTFKK